MKILLYFLIGLVFTASFDEAKVKYGYRRMNAEELVLVSITWPIFLTDELTRFLVRENYSGTDNKPSTEKAQTTK